VAALVALDLFALLGAAFHRTTVTTTRTVAAATPVAPAPFSTPGAAAPPPTAPAPTSVPVTLTFLTSALLPLPRTSDAPTASAPRTAAFPPYTAAPYPTATPCPAPVPSPSSNGGLQSLIHYAPAFGPFTAEAFAAASAYAPVLTLVGPILAQYPTVAPLIEPLVDPLLAAWEQVLAAGYGVVGPYYSPYRDQFIAAETQLATTLAPYSQSLAASSVASCVIDLQYTLISQAPSQ
jgi:hypothetical protein